MKKILLFITCTFSLLVSGSLSSTEIINMVAKIKEERIGISLAKLDATANPFPIQKKKKKQIEEKKEENLTVYTPAPVEVVYKLDAILNHAGFINNKWYRKGDTLDNYKVGYVSKESVTLRSKSGNRVLKLERRKKKFIKLKQGYRE